MTVDSHCRHLSSLTGTWFVQTEWLPTPSPPHTLTHFFPSFSPTTSARPSTPATPSFLLRIFFGPQVPALPLDSPLSSFQPFPFSFQPSFTAPIPNAPIGLTRPVPT